MARFIVIRLPRRAIFCLVPLIFALVVFELGQRVSDRLKASSRKAPPPYSIFFESASGVPVTDKAGTIALVLDPHLIYRHRPGQRLGHVTINAQGFRGPDLVREKTPGRARVIVIGGSVAFGQGASSDETVWTVPLARAIQAQLSRGEVEVLNAGIIGYDSMQERVLLETELLDYAPDVVVLLDGWNDMNSSCEVAADKRLAMSTFYELDAVLAQKPHWATNLLRLSAVYRSVERRRRRSSAGVGTGEQWRVHPDALPRYRRNLAAMGRLARSIGARLVIVAQPEPFGRSSAAPAAEAAVLAELDEGGYSIHVRASYPLFRRQAEEAARGMEAGFVDASASFDGLEEPVFVDRVHLNDLGNELLAAAVAPAVIAALAKEP